ncbi:MAG: GAF domain-containing sensor histidine kinase [Actinobacteria bacterium]|nr:GAF domain-containing sensor histidine kinase [Actinomycetota bacterium]
MPWTPPTWPDRVRVLLRTALSLTTERDLDRVLEGIASGAAEVVGARYAALGLYDDHGHITRFIHHGMDDDTVARIGRLPGGRGLLGEVIVADGPIRLDDLGADPRACGFPPGHPAMRTFLGVPVARGDRRYGNLYLTEKRSGTPFDEEDEALVVTLATFAAAAIQTAEIVRTVGDLAAAAERERAQRELLGAVIAAQEAERARVSRDLHDEIGQTLTSVLLALKLTEASLAGDGVHEADVVAARQRIAELRSLVADGLRDVRQLAFELRPTVLDDVGLAPALARLAEDVTARNLPVDLDVDGVEDGGRLSPQLETVVYRVVQEALTNVVRHAHANHASVVVSRNAGRVRAIIEDDGRGFSPGTVAGRHLGVQGMMERAELAGGAVDVTSTPGEGTTVVLEVPVG